MWPCIVKVFLSITNKMQRYTIFFITVNALHVSGGFSAHHQELKHCTHSIWCMSRLLAATATCFGRFLRPSSGAQTLYTQHLVYVALACCYRYMLRAVSPPIIRSSNTVHTASGVCRACLLLPLAVAASKLDIYPMLCVQFLSSWWWAEKPPETCRALTVKILYNVESCWLYLKNTNQGCY